MRDELDLTRSLPQHIFKRIVHRSAWKRSSPKYGGTRNSATPHEKRAGRLIPALDVAF
jgi:hypothetical protein